MRASSKRLRVESSSGAPPPPSSSGDPVDDEFVDSIAAVAAPPPSISDDSSIHHMLDIVMTIKVAHGQLLVDMLIELQALCVELASFRQSPLPPPFADE